MARGKRKSRDTNKDNESGDSNQSEDNSVSRGTTEKFELDQWQKEVLEHEGNIALRAGRQVGKSTIIALKAGLYAIQQPKKSIMVISATERQAYLLFSKILTYLLDNYKNWIKKPYSRNVTKQQVNLTNGSIIRCLPTGMDGLGIRGYTVDLLIADEAAFIPGDVWPAVIPMLATTGGKVILLSTPFGDKGYFYDCFRDKNFRQWHINAEIVAQARTEPQKSYMLQHQEEQKRKMSMLQYAQEYLGEFVSDFRRIFSDAIIKQCCTGKKYNNPVVTPEYQYFLGVDIARLGDDSSSYQIILKKSDPNSKLIHAESIVTQKKLTTETYDKILELNKQWNFREVGIDAGAGSLGVGIFDWLIREPIIRQKIVAINNLKKSLDKRGEQSRRILKEDLYDNLLALMEKNKIILLDDEDVIESLRAIQYEYIREEGKKTQVKIFASQHKFTDLVEGLIRAAWLANQKSLNYSIDYI